ncbi:MAG: hypothetical protein U0Q16_14415 [Bryobacteraceae bacterium]
MRIALFAIALAATAFAQIEPRIVSETLPAGSLMQIKLEVTTPTPISSTGTSLQLDSAFGDFEGIAVFSPTGDAFGAVVRNGTRAACRLVSPQNSLGTAADYPFLVLATPIRAGIATGTQIPVNIDAGSFWNNTAGQPYTAANVRGGILTIGGSAAITNVIPGGGVLPINSNVRVLGVGFNADTRLSVDGITIANSDIRLVNSNEIDFIVRQSVDLTSRRFRLRNKDNIEVTYYSYLRPTVVGSSARPLMAATYPVFSRQAATNSSLGIPTLPANGFVGIALLNANTAQADVQLEMVSPSNASLGKANATLPAGSRFSRTLQELFSTAPQAGGSVRIVSSQPLGILGIVGDESAGTATPFAPGAAPPPPAASLTVSPATISFNYQSGGAIPPSQTISVGSTGAASPFNAASNQPWLTVSPTSGTTPATLNVNVIPAGLSLGQQTGVITVTPSGGGTAQSVNVTLTVTAAPPPPSNPALSVSPASLSFNGSGSQPVSLTTSNGSNAGFTALASDPWLSVSPAAGTAPGSITVTVAAGSLTSGIYNGTVTVTPSNGTPARTIAVTLTVSGTPPANPSISVSPASLSFNGAGSQPVTLSTSSGGNIAFTASTSDVWLSVAPASGTAPGSVTVTTTPSALAPGTYNGTVTIAPANGTPPRTIAVTLTIAAPPANPTISALPSALSFNGAGSQPVSLTTSNGSAVPFTATASDPWILLAPTSGTAPGTLTVTANPASLAAGTYNGTVTITPSNGTPSRTVAVTMTIAGPPPAIPTISVSPASLSFNGAGSQQVALTTSNGAGVGFTAAASDSWLSAAPASGTAPGNISITVAPGSLALGTYNGTVTITPVNGTPARTIAVTLTLAAAAPLTLSPSSMSFTGAQSQALLVSAGSANITFIASVTMLTGSGWLSVTPSTGTTPATLSVNTAPGSLAPGTYSGLVNITPSSGAAPAPVQVTLTVTGAPPGPPRLTVNPQAFTFDYQVGGATPAAQLGTIQSTGTAINFTIASNATWLSGVASQATTPASLRVAVNPQGLAPGNYSGSLAITPSSGDPVTVTATLRVTSATSPNGPSVSSVVNAASQLAVGLAPGTLVTIYGSSLGPATPQGVNLTPSGDIDTISGGTRVYFGTALAPITYTSAAQVNAIVPFEVEGLPSVTVQVEYQGLRSSGQSVAIAQASPAFFTLNSSGRGPVAALNGDFTLNTADNPAPRGTAIVLYATGAGQTNPPSSTGSVGGADLRTTALPVTVSLGGRVLTPLYAGTSPGLTTGLIQINVLVPQDLAPGSAVPLSITVGSTTSPAGTTISIQ